jgi:hypothetical protein
MPTWNKIILSGSNAELSALKIDGITSGSIFSGSFVGDGSGITNVQSALTASYTEQLKSFGCGIFGNTTVIETGYYNSKRIESNGNIVSYRIDSIDNIGNELSGSIVFTLFKNNNFLGSASLSNSNTTFNNTLVGWNKDILFDDKIDFYVINNDTITNTILTVNYIQKT